MVEALRKVQFNLNESELSIGDLESEGDREILKEQQGLFHHWGEIVWYDSLIEKKLQKTIAIVKEIGTGKVFEVAPHCNTFE